ncbi:Rho GTPase-activating protein 27 [Pseudolycoriella hygida]|uniref:Rho GTPase-activating protein 27 n=1 Tax=Pseudolycoriella hygida TaxID=35572 RepID=A0A9Q0MV66_9DIPT|nr:Rho GTPase-activating protein 27 [Pseudolycoriella hygida]
MMSRNSENNYHGNNTINTYFNNSHIIQSDLYVPSLLHKNYDCPDGSKNIQNQFSNRSGESDGYFQLNHFFNDNLHPFDLVERVCENCGFNRHKGTKACDLCGYNEFLSLSPPPLHKSENIYENICEICGLIYSADKCEHCAKKVAYGSLRKNKQLNIFTGLIDNIRQKTKSKSKPKRKLPTIEIIHNVDSVFKTNETFDLNEICRLKSNHSSQRHVYGKLRKSEECLTSAAKHRIRSFGSDLNFSHLTSSNDFFAQNHTHSTSTNHSPIYENLKTFIYSTVSPAFSDITDNSLIYWLTSLKKYTNDYNEETVYNVKCIPSNSFSGCCNYRRSNGRLTSESEFNSNKIEDFKNSLMENQSKRKAIYFKEEKQYDPILVVVKDTNYLLESPTTEIPLNAAESLRYVDDQQHVNESEYSFLRPKNFQFQSALVDIIDEKTSTEQLTPVISEVTALLPVHNFRTPKKRKTISTKILSLNRLIFSIALNRVVITYDCDFMTFINNITRNRKIVKPFFKSEIRSIADNPVKCGQSRKSKISDFEKPMKFCDDLGKKQINDYEIKSPVTENCQRRLEDFEKLKPSSQLRKQLRDFELKHNIDASFYRKPITFIETMNNKPANHSNGDDADDIYQPIWKFQTIGYAKENYLLDQSDVCLESQSNGIDDDIGEWELDDEFAYSTELCADDCDNKNVSHVQDQYQSVCILYNLDDPKLNQMIYETDHAFGFNDYKNKSVTQLSPIIEEEQFCFDRKKATTTESLFTLPSPVQAWKIMLWNVNYMEDEEDLNIPESFFTERALKQQLSEQNIASAPIEIAKKSNDEISPIITPTRKEGFLDKFQFGRIDIAKNAGGESKDVGVHCVSYKKKSDFVEIMEAKKIPGHLVYGVEMDEIEKDDKHSNVPKFVVECIGIIENQENLITNGIYRASGKKESIDKIKKKMNETKPKKGSKYSILKDEDVHTITGSLKQFFREMKTDLIPIDIFHNLPSNLETEESVKIIAKEIDGIAVDSKMTLKYLLRHLVKVDANSKENLMNASNLSIVWGACLFTSSVTFNDTFETSDLIRKNTLIKVLIQRYNDIFPNHDD